MTARLPSVQIAVSVRWAIRHPSVGSHHAVLVDPADQEVVAALRAALDVLALEVTAVRGRVAVDAHLVVPDEVLGAVEPAERTVDALDDGVDALAVDVVQVSGGVGGNTERRSSSCIESSAHV